MNPAYLMILAGVWIGSLIAAAGVTWALTRVSAHDVPAIMVNVALGKSDGEANAANRADQEPSEESRMIRNARRVKSRMDDETDHDALSRAYLKLALQRFVESAISRSGKPISPAPATNTTDTDLSEPIFPTAAKLLSNESGSWLSDMQGNNYPALQEIMSWLDQWDDSTSIQDLFAHPEMLESAGGMLERVMDEVSGLQGQFAGRMSGMGQGLSGNLEPLFKTLETLSALRQEGWGDGALMEELGSLVNQNGWSPAQSARQRLGLLFLMLLRHNAEKAGIEPSL